MAGSNLPLKCMVAFMVAKLHDLSIKYFGGIFGGKDS